MCVCVQAALDVKAAEERIKGLEKRRDLLKGPALSVIGTLRLKK